LTGRQNSENETKDETMKQSLSTIDASCYAIAASNDKAKLNGSILFDLCHAVPQSASDFIKSPFIDQ
jgi:sulfide:quinone oxidoreductase